MLNLVREIKMTSLELSKITNKKHSHIMRDIRNEINALKNINESIFGLVDYIDAKGEKRPCYKFGKSGAMQLALKYDPQTRYKVIKKIEELENKSNLPQNYEEALEQLLIQVKQNKELMPKASNYDLLIDSRGNQPVGSFAKTLGIGRNTLFRHLRDIKLLRKNNEPYQVYITMNIFICKQHEINGLNVRQTFITPKGIDYITNKLKDNNVI